MASAAMIFGAIIVVMCIMGVAAVNCPNMHYMDRKLSACAPCSTCPPGQVPHRQCYGYHDTKCGSLPNFNFVHDENDVKADDKVSPEVKSEEQSGTTLVITEQDNEDKWFAVTMILVCIIVLATIIGVVAVLVFCVANKHRQRKWLADSGKFNFSV